MLLHNHGTLTVGRTCAEAFLRMYFLERACTMQVRTRMLGGAAADYPTAPEVIEKNAALARSGGLSTVAEQLVWPALLRKLDRIDPGFQQLRQGPRLQSSPAPSGRRNRRRAALETIAGSSRRAGRGPVEAQDDVEAGAVPPGRQMRNILALRQ